MSLVEGLDVLPVDVVAVVTLWLSVLIVSIIQRCIDNQDDIKGISDMRQCECTGLPSKSLAHNTPAAKHMAVSSQTSLLRRQLDMDG
eukprot:1962726-Amphidinium_carterae.1